MSAPQDGQDRNDKPSEYGRGTLIVAGLIFVGFALLLYFLPVIMTAILSSSSSITAA